jgi:hydrogenase nickel incorporation protein HypB
MCATCGCDGDGTVRLVEAAEIGHQHPHSHQQKHSHEHEHEHETISLEQRVLDRNDRLAEVNRAWFAEQELLAVNLMSSPGSGKTTLLVRTVTDLFPFLGMSVIEGDQETALDAERLAATGCPVVQVNTGSGCHLDAGMIERALGPLRPPAPGVVFIENVGNLVCPALFDLGERERVVIASVPEGADKPLKYPAMFHSASLVILNKIDLAPYVDFDEAAFERAVSMVTRHASVLRLSATTGEGLGAWYEWLQVRAKAQPVLP